jgi:hypothetical protein
VLTIEDIEAQCAEVVRVGTCVRCADVTPRSTLHYHIALGVEHGRPVDLLTVSADLLDDAFAALVVEAAGGVPPASVLEKRALPANGHGFDALLLVPPHYHDYFAGRLDAERDRLILCVPIYGCEFAGDETAEIFRLLTREVPIHDWQRFDHPRTQLRFSNPVTGGGTDDAVAGGYVFAGYDLVLRELANLDGVADGFVELVNHRSRVMELLSPVPGRVVILTDRDDATKAEVDASAAADIVWGFLAAS